MAGMAAVSATILARNKSTQDDSRISTSEQSLSSLRDFLVPAPDPSGNGSAGSIRAPKRRKLASGKSFAVQPVEAFDKTASALLKTITIKFVSDIICSPVRQLQANVPSSFLSMRTTSQRKYSSRMHWKILKLCC